MFGIDIGISVSLVSCITIDNKVLDCTILFGDKKDKDEWQRVVNMADTIVDTVTNMCKAQPKTYIEPLVSLEEPIYPYRTMNPRSYFNMSCLYALIRNKLGKRGFTIYSINPVSVKSTAKAWAFKDKHLSSKLAIRGRLTKTGMIKAFNKVVGTDPMYHTKVGKETLADSFFIARTGLDRKSLNIT